MTTARRLRILFAPETFNLGETTRAVETARQARDRGHEVHFMGYSRRFARYIRDAGFTLDLLDPELSERQADQLIAADQGRSVRHPFTADVIRRRVDSERALFEKWRPDCVVIGTTLSLFISARAASLPLIYIRPYAMSRTHLSRMTAFPVMQGQRFFGNLVNRAAAEVVKAIAPRVTWKPSSFRAVAAENRVTLPSRTLEALDGDLNLLASHVPPGSPSEQTSGDIPVGPIYARDDEGLPDAVKALAESRRKVVYVGLGSSAGRRLAVKLLQQIARLDVEVISTAGRYLTGADREGLPNNVHLYEYLPAARPEGIIDASVIHGGEGTVQTACASGKPFAGIGLQTEQRISIDECVRRGNALRFTRRDLRRGDITRIVHTLLRSADMISTAEKYRPLARPTGARNAVMEIEKFMGR